MLTDGQVGAEQRQRHGRVQRAAARSGLTGTQIRPNRNAVGYLGTAWLDDDWDGCDDWDLIAWGWS